MYHVLLIVQVIITLSMIVIILLQRSSSDGLGGMGGGSGGGLITTRAQANLLTRATAILATLFIINSLALGWLTHRSTAASSIADKVLEEQHNAPQVPMPGEEAKTDKKADKKTEMPAEPSAETPASGAPENTETAAPTAGAPDTPQPE